MKNRITEILGVRYPFILGPMRCMTLGEMAAAVSNSGGFGQIATSGLSAEMLRREIATAGELTDKPFGLNMPIYRPNAMEAIEIAIEMGVKTVTTSAGNPVRVMARIRGSGLKVLHKVSTVEMALKAQDAGVDGVIATGYEAGGHVGKEDTTTFCLVPQLVDSLDIPVVAAGGICDARGLLAAFALGAEGVEVGTRFMATYECPVPDFKKQAVVDARGTSTLILARETMPIRVLRNMKSEKLSKPEEKGEKYSEKGDDESGLQSASDAEDAIIPAGQVASLIQGMMSVGDVFPQMLMGARELATRLDIFFKGGD